MIQLSFYFALLYINDDNVTQKVSSVLVRQKEEEKKSTFMFRFVNIILTN